jgi:hypothetical protein
MATVRELTAKLVLDNSDFLSGMKKSIDKFKDVGKEAQTMAKSLVATTGSLKGAALASHAFKVALASTGIGAIVIALGSLVAYLTTTQAGMDKLRRVTEPVAQIFQRLLGVLQDLGGNVFKGLAQLLNGDIKEGFKTIGQGAKQAGQATISAFGDGIKAGKELVDMQIAIETAQNDLILTTSRLNRQIAEQSEIARDATKSEAQRAAAAQKAIQLIDERVKAEDNVLQMQIKSLKLQQSANDTDRKGNAELNQLIAAREELLSSAARERVRLNSISNKGLSESIDLTKELISLEREQLANFLGATKGLGKGVKSPFSMEADSKYSKEVLGNVKQISSSLLKAKTDGLGIIITPEMSENVEIARQRLAQTNHEIALTNQLANSLGQVFTASFEAMLISGNISFKGIIQGLKGMIIQLIAAAAAAFALNALLGGLGIGKTLAGGAFGSSGGFKDLFSSFTGLPRFANGGMVTGLTTAVLGDNPSGREAVIPFERMGEFLGKFGGGGNMRVEVVGRLEGETIFLQQKNYQDRNNRRFGF